MLGPKVPVTLPGGQRGEGIEVQVDESTQRWSEFKLQDGSVIRVKVSVLSAVRVEGQYDPMGNPMYMTNITPVISVTSPEHLRRKTQ